MSKYLVFTDVVFPSETLLLDALQRLGFRADQVERGERLPLFGYRGDQRPETAELVVRRQHLTAASNDLGFTRTERGLAPIISEYDQQVLRQGRFLRDLRVAYAEAAIEAVARARRGTLSRQQVGGVTRITVRY